MKHPYLLALPCYALDQLTKLWVVKSIPYQEARPVIAGFFELVHVGNPGAAFGSFQRSGLFLGILAITVFVGLTIAWHLGHFRDRLQAWGLGLLMGGILGNVTDRLLYGHVIDFLSFDLHVRFANPWPAFNVADSCIFLAVACFLIASFREGRQPSSPPA